MGRINIILNWQNCVSDSNKNRDNDVKTKKPFLYIEKSHQSTWRCTSTIRSNFILEFFYYLLNAFSTAYLIIISSANIHLYNFIPQHKKTIEKVSGMPKTETKASMNLPCHQPSPFHLQQGCSCTELIGPLESGIGVTMLISAWQYNNFKIALYPHPVQIKWILGPSCPTFYRSYPRPHKSLHHVCHCEPEKEVHHKWNEKKAAQIV